MSIGEEHAFVVDAFGMLNRKLPDGCYLRVQQPIALPPDSVPEPDGSLVCRDPGRYESRLPGPADVLVVIEVAESSLQQDRTTKLRLYADAGLPQYVIANLVDRTVDDYRDPIVGEGRYARVTRLRPGDVLTLALFDGKTLEVPVASLTKATRPSQPEKAP